MKLVISLATRSRPEKLLDTIKRDLACLSHPDTVLMVQADDDDLGTIAALGRTPLDSRVVVNVRAREDTIAGKWNWALAESGDLYVVTGDDDPWVVPDSDRKLLDAAAIFPDNIGFVHGQLANLSFSGIIGLTKGLTDVLGYIQPEHFPYWFCDHWTTDLGKMTGRTAYANVWTDRQNVGKTMEMREPGWWATWYDAAYLLRQKEAEHIFDCIGLTTPQQHRKTLMRWQKKLLKSAWPNINTYSRWINDSVRYQERALLSDHAGAKTDEERYQRVKQKAIDMLPQLLDGMTEWEKDRYMKILSPPTTVPNLMRA